MKLTPETKDFRGLHLCRPCWQGDENHKRCEHGECECPCQKMEQNAADENYKRRQTKIANKKAQTSLLDNCPMIQIGPQVQRDDN